MRKIENELSLKNMTFLRPWKQIVVFAIGLIGLILFEIVAQLLMSFIARAAIGDQTQYSIFMSSTTASMILNGATYFIIFVIFLILLKDDFIELFKSFKGWRPYVAAITGFAAIMMFNIVYNMILSATGVIITDNANEAGLNTMVTDFPLLSIFIFGLIGPICEELTYRVGLFSFFRRINVFLAYFVTIIVFAFIHFDFTSAYITNELLNIPFYAFAAVTFTFLYEKYGFASSMAAHVTNNVFSILATIFTSSQ